MVPQLHIKASTAYDVGLAHGAKFPTQIRSSIAFYARLFHRSTGLTWPQVRLEASKFLPLLDNNEGWRRYVEEMKGVADGAGEGVEFEDVLALNVRTEIAYGMAWDGCTALAWRQGEGDGRRSFLAQNWDWNPDQSSNIIALRIEQPGKPTIHMMTEAGIIGKIGLNSSGVGVTLNAIKGRGVDFGRLPVHLALRRVLESNSCDEALRVLGKVGVAAACHVLIADPKDMVGLECTAFDVVRLGTAEIRNTAYGGMGKEILTHTNHFIEPHKGGPSGPPDLPDSPFRLERINELLEKESREPSFETIGAMLEDEVNLPGAICRAHSVKDGFATLFSIIMDLDNRKAQVKMGRPTESTACLMLEPK